MSFQKNKLSVKRDGNVCWGRGVLLSPEKGCDTVPVLITRIADFSISNRTGITSPDTTLMPLLIIYISLISEV